MPREVLTRIKTTCDICGAELYDGETPSQKNSSITVNGKYLNVYLKLDAFDFAHKLEYICRDCVKEMITQMFQQ